jgi:hypothetical protein
MGKTILTNNGSGSGGTTTANTSNNFFQLSNGWIVRRNTEATSQIVYRTAGTISNVYVRVTANSNAGSVTFRTRKNAANGNASITIAASATGTFEDTSNTDTVAAGDKMCYQSTIGGATGTMNYSLLSCIFDASTNYISRLACDGSNLTSASTTSYFPLSGQTTGVTSVEANAQHKIKKAGTFKNLCISITSNARTTDTVFTLRLNGADTALTVTVAGGAAGFTEDTSNTVSVAVDDLLDFKTVTSTGTGTLVLDNLVVSYESTTRHGFIDAGALGASGELVVNANTTNYAIPGGETRVYTTEAEAKLKPRMRINSSFLSIAVGANTVSATSTFNLRVNGADVTQTLSIGANTTGYFHDITHTDMITATDEFDYQLITGATGTSMTIRQMSLYSLEQFDRTKTLSDTKTIGETSFTRLKAVYKTLGDTTTIGEALARINAFFASIAAQTITIGESVVRVATRPAILKTLSQTTLITEGMGRLKAVWRLQP